MKLKRIQFDIPEDRLEELNRMQEKLGLSTRKDLFNNAMTLLQWVIREKEKGCRVATVDEGDGSYRELVMPALQNIRASEEGESAHFVS